MFSFNFAVINLLFIEERSRKLYKTDRYGRDKMYDSERHKRYTPDDE